MQQASAGRDNRSAKAHSEALSQLDQELAAGQARVRERRAERLAALGELKSARAAASDLSWELEDLEQRLRDLQEQREGPGDPLLERELASLAGRRAALEEQVLAQMLLVDDLAARAGAAAQALADAEQAWSAREAALLVERDRIAQVLAQQPIATRPPGPDGRS